MKTSWVDPEKKDVQSFLNYYEKTFGGRYEYVRLDWSYPAEDREAFCSALDQTFTELAQTANVWMSVQDLKQYPNLRFRRKGPKHVHGTIRNPEDACALLGKCCEKYQDVSMAKGLADSLKELRAREALACAKGLHASEEDIRERDFVRAVRKILDNIRHEFHPLGEFYPEKNEIVLYYETIGEELVRYGITDPWEALNYFYELLANVFAHEYFHALHCDQAPFLFEKHQGELHELCETIIEAEAEFAAFALTIADQSSFGFEIAEWQYKGWLEPKPYFWPYDRALDLCEYDLRVMEDRPVRVNTKHLEEEFRWSAEFSTRVREINRWEE